MTGIYTNPIQFIDNRQGTQIVNATNLFGDLMVQAEQLRIAVSMNPTFDNHTAYEQKLQAANKVRHDIRNLVRGEHLE